MVAHTEREFNEYLASHKCANPGCFRPRLSPRTPAESCEISQDFNTLVSRRQFTWFKDDYVDALSLWQQSINNKLGAFLFARHNGIRVAEILFCTDRGVEGLEPFFENRQTTSGGFVVKPLKGHSSLGVNVMESGFGGRELLSGRDGVTKEEVMADVQGALNAVGDSVVLVEERMKGEAQSEVPFDYKFYMFGARVGGVLIVKHRGQPNECELWVDENFQRMDRNGCRHHDSPIQVPCGRIRRSRML